MSKNVNRGRVGYCRVLEVGEQPRKTFEPKVFEYEGNRTPISIGR